ncbi:MAG: SurA N-terminal domain-containing protein [Candidatus Aminicenantes bacterium]|nr:MAG: SurA N-terminal domain-containing protein [Candidatus Aminicenantes bacterium]
MLRTMREDFKKYSWTLWLVIIAFVGGFIVTDAFRGKDRVEMGLVYIDDDPVIRGEEYQRQLLRQLQNFKERYKENFNKSMIARSGIPERTLQEMIQLTIILMEAEKLNIKVSDEELNNRIINHPMFQQDGKFIGETNYLRFLAEGLHMDVTEFEDQFKKQIIGEKLQELVTGPLVMDDDTLQDKYKKEKDQTQLDFITFKPERIKKDINVGDNELADYYEKNKEEFKSVEKRAAYVIAFKFDDYKKEAKITPKEIYEFFKTKRSDFRLPGKTKVSRIFLKYGETDRDEVFKKAEALQKELTKDNFAEKAKLHSQDNKAREGGDYGYNGWQNFTHQEKTMIEALEQHQISTPIDTQQGFSIVYISEKIAEREQTFNEVQDKIKGTMEDERVRQLVTEKLQKIYNKLGKTENIKAKAQEMGITAIETELLTNGQAIKGIDEMGYISRRMFTLKEKEIAFPLQFVKGIAIVQLSKIEEPTVESFYKVKNKVEDKVVLAKKVELLKEEAANISTKLNRMTDEKKIEAFLKKEDLSPTAVAYKRGNRLSRFPVRMGLDDLVFSMEENRFSSPMAFNDQVVIFKVKSKTITNTADFEKEKADFYTQEITRLKNSFFWSYITNKMSTYKIATNQELFDQIKEWVITRFN